MKGPVNPVNLVTGEPESGIGVQGVQGVQGKICAGCAGVHGLFSKSLCRCARSFQKLFCRCAGVHGLFKNFFCPGECIPKTFSNRSAPCTDLKNFFKSPCTGAQKLFQIALHRCTETFSNHPAHRAQDLCKSPCTPCTGSTFSGEKSLKNRLGRVYYPAGGRDHEGFDQQRLQF